MKKILSRTATCLAATAAFASFSLIGADFAFADAGSPVPIVRPQGQPGSPTPGAQPHHPGSPTPGAQQHHPGSPTPVAQPNRPGSPTPVAQPNRPGSPTPVAHHDGHHHGHHDAHHPGAPCPGCATPGTNYYGSNYATTTYSEPQSEFGSAVGAIVGGSLMMLLGGGLGIAAIVEDTHEDDLWDETGRTAVGASGAVVFVLGAVVTTIGAVRLYHINNDDGDLSLYVAPTFGGASLRMEF